MLREYVCQGSTGCHSSGNTSGWGRSAIKLTSRVFSALKNISGSFVTIEDGILSTTSQDGIFAPCDISELAEDAVLEVDRERSSWNTDIRVNSIPVIELDAADVIPVQVELCTNRNPPNKDNLQRDNIEQSLPSLCSHSSAEISQNFLSCCSEFDDRSLEELVNDRLNGDDNIVFSSGVKRKIRRTKETKDTGSSSYLHWALSK